MLKQPGKRALFGRKTTNDFWIIHVGVTQGTEIYHQLFWLSTNSCSCHNGQVSEGTPVPQGTRAWQSLAEAQGDMTMSPQQVLREKGGSLLAWNGCNKMLGIPPETENVDDMIERNTVINSQCQPSSSLERDIINH